ncbi:thiolase family protein [Paradesulfitobacterium ferrireducens]|uniref:thiolase family protein n=1 Tax=Paradesulfitobacterium ferrireducens TaxID=2816476 RepID=UPI001A909826|nr:thiolase family protein [Paradesulfitobacterium ferrireducens]
MREVYVIGVGMTPFGKFPNRPYYDLGKEAVVKAVKDANVDKREIQAGYVGNVKAGMAPGQKVFKELGMTGMQIVNVENACSSGQTALNLAYTAVASGQYDMVMAVGTENLTGGRTGGEALAPDQDDIEGILGNVMPGIYAMRARRYMEQYGATDEDLALVAVKNHKHSSLNPYAQYRNLVTVEEVLASRKVAEPFTLLQCCPVADGAAVAVVCSKEKMLQLGAKGVKIEASILVSGLFKNQPSDMTIPEITQRASRLAYEMAGIGPEDINMVECHDAFTIAEFLYYETLGFCGKGEAASFLRSGQAELGGRHVFSVRGGLLCMGHPLGATGVAQTVEAVWQLRGQAGDRQIQGAKTAMIHITGGGVSGMDNAACGVHIFSV